MSLRSGIAIVTAAATLIIILAVVNFGAVNNKQEGLPGFNSATAVQALYSGAVDLGTPGWDPVYGWGRLDICGSLNAMGIICPAATPMPVDGIAELPELGDQQ